MAGSGTCFVHVGVHKTGSTAIQTFLHSNAKLLRAREMVILPPHFAVDLFVCSADDHRPLAAKTNRHLTNAAEIAAHRDYFTRRVSEEASLIGDRDCVISLESLSILEDEEVARMAHLLGGLSKTVKIVIYLRRQDLQSVSALQERIRGGASLDNPFELPGKDYREILQRFQKSFSKKALLVRVFDRKEFPHGDVVADFADLTGIRLEGLGPPRRVRESLPGNALVLMRWFNQYPSTLNPHRRKLLQTRFNAALETLPAGEALAFSRAEAMAYASRFQQSNDWVRRQYFPKRKFLFDDDYSMFPESPANGGRVSRRCSASAVPPTSSWPISRSIVSHAAPLYESATLKGCMT